MNDPDSQSKPRVPRQRTAARPDGSISDKTAERRLSAGTYIDRDFRDQALRDVYCDRFRRVAPSYGFDLTPILTHAWRAWRLEMGQHIVVLAILVLALVKAPIGVVLVLGTLTFWYAASGFGSLGRDTYLYFRRRTSALEAERLTIRGKTLGYVLGGSGMVVAGITLAALNAGNRWFDLDRSWPIRGGLGAAAVIVVALGAVVVVFSSARRLAINGLHHEQTLSRGDGGRRLSTIRRQQVHPFTVYDGFKPFVGSGVEVRTWSFAQRLIHEKALGRGRDKEYRNPPFFTADLVNRLTKQINRLSVERNAETRLPGLTVRDHVFVQGTHAGPYRDALAVEPDDASIATRVAAIMADPSDPNPDRRHDVARHYLACQVASWGGEVVTTVFVHVSLQGRTLYIEFSTYALMPTREEYRVMDEVGGAGLAAIFRTISKDLTHLPEVVDLRRLRSSPIQLWTALLAQRDRTIAPKRNVNIGAKTSLREVAATELDGSYFQFRDVYKHSKIIERRLLGAVGDFLKKHDVDITEFWQRANGILNTGVLISGSGPITISDSAIGTQASVDVVTSPAGE